MVEDRALTADLSQLVDHVHPGFAQTADDDVVLDRLKRFHCPPIAQDGGDRAFDKYGGQTGHEVEDQAHSGDEKNESKDAPAGEFVYRQHLLVTDGGECNYRHVEAIQDRPGAFAKPVVAHRSRGQNDVQQHGCSQYAPTIVLEGVGDRLPVHGGAPRSEGPGLGAVHACASSSGVGQGQHPVGLGRV